MKPFLNFTRYPNILLSLFGIAILATANAENKPGVVVPKCFSWLGDSAPADGFISLRDTPSSKGKLLAKMILAPGDLMSVKSLGSCSPEISILQTLTLSPLAHQKLLNAQWCAVEYKGIKGWAKSGLMDEGVCNDLPRQRTEDQFFVCSTSTDDPVLILSKNSSTADSEFLIGFYTESQSSHNEHLKTMIAVEKVILLDGKNLGFENMELQFSSPAELQNWQLDTKMATLFISKDKWPGLDKKFQNLFSRFRETPQSNLKVSFNCRPGSDSRFAR